MTKPNTASTGPVKQKSQKNKKSTTKEPVEVHQDEPQDKKQKQELTAQQRKERDEVAPFLLNHAYHLPGYNITQDWWQFMTNNHPLFGIWLHHKYHPLSWKIRAISLLGSLLFGLALTSIVYCAFVFTGQDSEQELFNLHTNATRTGLNTQLDNAVTSVSVTTGNLVLFFVGAPIHSIYDSLAWTLAGCPCITFKHHDGKCAKLFRTSGAFIVSLSVVVIMAVASFSIMLQAALEADQDMELVVVNTTASDDMMDNVYNSSTSVVANLTSLAADLWDNVTTTGNNNLTDAIATTSGGPNILESHTQVQSQFAILVEEQNFQDYQFVISYLVELVLTWLIYYPIAGTILFSGWMAKWCCCAPDHNWPLLGGRPYEIKQLNQRRARKQREEEEAMEQGEVEVEYNHKPVKASTKRQSLKTEQSKKDAPLREASKKQVPQQKPKPQKTESKKLQK